MTSLSFTMSIVVNGKQSDGRLFLLKQHKALRHNPKKIKNKDFIRWNKNTSIDILTFTPYFCYGATCHYFI